MLFFLINNYWQKQLNSLKKINKYSMRYSVLMLICHFLHPLFSNAQKKILLL